MEKSKLQRAFDLAEEMFDFQKAHTIMQLFGWTWFESGDETPTIAQMKKCVEGLFSHVVQTWNSTKKDSYCSSGGFRVYLDSVNEEIGIEFIAVDYARSLEAK